MLHPSYTDLIDVVNSDIEPGEQPVVQSRYSIVIAASRRARQIIGGDAARRPLRSLTQGCGVPQRRQQVWRHMIIC